MADIKTNGGDGGDGDQYGRGHIDLGGHGDYDPQIGRHLSDDTVDHGWGDVRTWFIILGLCVALVGSTLLIYTVIGKRTLQHWNLGWPPTSPGVILPLLGGRPAGPPV